MSEDKTNTSSSAIQPLVTSDKSDYAPGDTATFTASGFSEGATLQFQVQHVDGSGEDQVWGTFDDELDSTLNGASPDHEPFYAIDGVGIEGLDGQLGTEDDLPETGVGGLVADLDGARNGTVVTSWFVNPDDSLDERFLLTAREGERIFDESGATVDFIENGVRASATFTDGQLGLWAWRNQPGPTFETWDQGTTIQQANSIYAEDEAIPFRWTSESGGGAAPDLQEGVQYTIQIDYAFAGGTTSPEKFFFDYLVSYDATEAAAAPFGPGSDLAGFQSGNLSTVAIPNDPNPDIVGQTAGVFDLFNIDPTSVTFGAYTADPVNANQEDRQLTITFTPDDGDGVAGEFLDVGVAWGAHLASQTDYGFENGAASFPGASPQMVVDLDPTNAGDTTNLNINPNAIVAQGQITIIKDATPDDAQDFGFTITGPDGANITPTFTLDDDADPALSNQVTFFGLAEGEYIITENATSGWELTGITDVESGAEDTTSDDIFVADTAARTATITVANGEVWTVTFDNGLAAEPSILVEKTNGGVVDLDGNGDDAGDQIVYGYDVSNDGNVTLTDVTLDDDQLGAITLSGLTDEDGDGALDDLAVGATATGSATATLTQDQIDAGSVTNLATGTATDPNGGPVEDDDSNTVAAAQAPLLDVVKTNGGVVDLDGNGDDAGDQIVYGYDVTNDGNVTLTDVTLDDDQLGAITLSGLTDEDGDGALDDLAVGATATGSATATLTQDQIDAGSVTNLATGTATDPNGGPVEDDDSNTVAAAQAPLLDVVKTNGGVVDLDGNGDDAGDQIVYGYDVTNDGNVTLTDVTLDDDQLGAITLSGLTDEDGDGALDDLAVGATATGSATATLTQDQIDAGSVTNLATGTATDPNGGPVEDDDSNTVAAAQAPLLDVVKTNGGVVDLDGNGDDAGDQIVYGYDVTNDGNVTLTDVTLDDDQLGAITLSGLTDEDGDGALDDLAVGATATGSATATLTQDQIDAGSVVNLATGTATDPNGGPVEDEDSNTVAAAQAPLLDVVKTNGGVVDLDGNGDDAGDQIVYGYDVTNDGNVTLTDVTLDDDQLGAITLSGLTDEDGDGALDDLAVGATATGSATATLTQDQIDAGSVTNLATGTATDPNGGPVEDDDSNTVAAAQAPLLDVVKTNGGVVDLDGNGDDAGDQIVYGYDVTNDGNVTLTDVTLDDDQLGAITLSGLTDEDGDGALDDLAVGATATGSATATLTQDQIDAGSVTNLATGTATDPNGGPVEDDDSNTVAAAQAPLLDVVKTNGGVVDLDGNGDDAGDQIVYGYDVTNDGNVTLTDVTLDDDQLGAITLSGLTDEDGDGALDDLAVGATATGSATATLTQDQIDAGSVTNLATGTATDPNGGPVEDEDSNTVAAAQAPLLDVVKTNGGVVDLDGNGDDAGDQIVYGYDVTNDGNVTLTDVTLDDDQLGAITLSGLTDEDGDGALDDLAVGATATGSATATLTQDQIDAGSVTNLATGAATDPNGGPVEDDDSNTVAAAQAPAIDLVKTGTFNDDGSRKDRGDGLAQVGESITYSFAITNAGNVTLDDIVLDDFDDVGFGPFNLSTGEGSDQYTLRGDALSDGLMAPGESWTVLFDYALTAADVSAEQKYNLATAGGKAPDGSPVTDEDDHFVFLPANQRSISQDVSPVGYICETDSSKFSGSVEITDASDDGGNAQYDVDILEFDVTLAEGRGRGTERDVTVTAVWIDDDGNGLRDSGEAVLADADPGTDGWQFAPGALRIAEPDDDVVLGFEFMTDDDLALGEHLRITAETEIGGRNDKIFTDTETFQTSLLPTYVCEEPDTLI